MQHDFSRVTQDGINLYAVVDEPELADPLGAVLLVHGICEHLDRYGYLTRELLKRGFVVYRFDQRGHGRSEGKRVYYERFDEIIEDISLMVTAMKASAPSMPHFLLGHSMGGYGAAMYATANGGQVDGVVLSGAPLREGSGFFHDIDTSDRDKYIPNAVSELICSDPEEVYAYCSDPLVEREISVSLLETMNQGMAYLTQNPDDFTDPVLVLHGANDGIVSPHAALRFFEEIASADKGLRIYEGMMHEVFKEFMRDRVIRDVADWMVDHTVGN